jgi:hypothetical protein
MQGAQDVNDQIQDQNNMMVNLERIGNEPSIQGDGSMEQMYPG